MGSRGGNLFITGWTLLVIILAAPSAFPDWPTLHRDNQRSGYTSEQVKGPFERKWFRDFHDEMIATRCEAIVAEGKVFLGTFAGSVIALDIETGETVWRFKAEGPVGASPCYYGGKLFVGSDDRFDHGTLHCLRASDGHLIWKGDTPGGIQASPVTDGDRVYIGDRTGLFHAFNVGDGSPAWAMETGYMILKPASISTDGSRIVVGSEDMHVYCFSPDGGLLWRSPKLEGLSLRDQGPTLWQGLAIVRTNPADAFHRVLGRNGENLEAIQRALPSVEGDEVLLEKWDDLLMRPTPRRRQAENEGVVKYLRENRYDQTFYAFDMKDGSEPWVAPVFFTSGLHNPPTPPTFNPETGALYTLTRTALTLYIRGVRRYSGLCRLDRRTGMPDWFWPEEEKENWQAFPMIPDETQALSLMGNLIIGTHQGMVGAIDPETGTAFPIQPYRDSYGGIFGPGVVEGGFDGAKRLAREGYLTGMPNEWHGPDRAIVSISDGRIFWVTGSQVVCVAGPDKKRMQSGGAKPPPPFKSRLPRAAPKGNVASSSEAEDEPEVERLVLKPSELWGVIHTPMKDIKAMPSDPEMAGLIDLLDQKTRELINGADGKPWAPWVVQLGISGEEVYYLRSGETMGIVAQTLPWLSPGTRKDAIAWLDGLFQEGLPLDHATLPIGGARREYHDLGPGMRETSEKTPRIFPGLDDLYACQAYAHYVGRWSEVLMRLERIEFIFDTYVRNRPFFNPNDMEHDAAQRLNQQINGMIAAARIFEKSGDDRRLAKAMEILAELVADRVHHERSDRRLVRPTRDGSSGMHSAKVPRYIDMTPELGGILKRYAAPALDGNLSDLRRALPLWYQAWGERMIGGENFISPPNLSRGVFVTWALGTNVSTRELLTKLDRPWCRADLYYIEKILAVIRLSSVEEEEEAL